MELRSLQDQPFCRAPVILHTISSLDRTAMEKAALPILKGLSLCLRGPRRLRNEIVNTQDFWSTIRAFHSIHEAAGEVFELSQGILEDSPSAITADNYEATVLLLNDFASAGSAGAMIEQRDRSTRRPKQAQPLSAR